MAIERPKILGVVTVPTGGWDLKIYISVSAQFDQAVTATVAAGDYFVANDNQTDCLLHEVQDKLQAAVQAIGGGFASAKLAVYLDSSHKVVLKFDDGFEGATQQDVRLAWTEGDSDLHDVLGFDTSADDDLTGSDYPSKTADYQHGYGWYADEDGYLEFKPLHDQPVFEVRQSRSWSGVVKTQKIGEWFNSEIRLFAVSRAKTWSNGVDYGSAPVYPYDRNVPFECAWRKMAAGQRFRFYRAALIDTTKSEQTVTATGGSTTTIVDSGASWTTDEWKGGLVYTPDPQGSPFDDSDIPITQYVSSNTATTLTVSADTNADWTGGGETHYLFRYGYGTYVLEGGNNFAQAVSEISGLDRFSISLRLMRYES